MEVVGHQRQRKETAVGLVRIGVTEFEKSPFRFVGDGTPAAGLVKGGCDGMKVDLLVVRDESVVSPLPENKYHRGECEGFLAGDRVLPPVSELPFVDENISVGRTGRAPDVNLLLPIDGGTSSFQRAFRKEIDGDFLSVPCFLELRDGPDQPTFLFRPVGNPNGGVGTSVIAAAGGDRGGRRGRAARTLGRILAIVCAATRSFLDQPPGSDSAGGDEEKKNELAEEGQAGAVFFGIHGVGCRG